MTDSPLAVWSVFISGVLAAVILLAGFVAAVVLSQRRYLNLHRSHARRILEAQEEERAWVSREIHDDAVQRVALIGRECADLAEREGVGAEEQAELLESVQGELRDLGQFLRGLAHRLHPSLIDRGGLPQALVSLGEEIVRVHGVRVSCRISPEDRPVPLSPPVAIALYRIAQEALHNVVKHAVVISASLELTTSGEAVELVIRDQGRGFSPGANRRAGGIGLMGMRERALLAGGDLAIVSTPGGGTTVRVTVPRAASPTVEAA